MAVTPSPAGTRERSRFGRTSLLVIAISAVLCGCVMTSATPSLQDGDPIKGLTTPPPPPVAMVEGVADLGNTKLWYWDTGGPGTAVVLLHPGSGSGEFYPYQQPAFAKAGYRVISYSRRGQYKSERGTDADTYFAADDLLNLMRYLNVEKFHVVGNALGGYIGLDVAISHPERVLSLVLACSMMGISEPEYTRTLQSLRPKAFSDLPVELKELGPSYRAANPSGVAEWKKLHERAGTGSPVRLRNKITWPALANLKAPTLLVTGDADLWIPPYMLRQVGEKIPNSKVVVVPNSGHAVQWEQPEIFNNTVLDFIRTKSPG
jgi:pimeloyl-ACP methyl ester carboxylesterase